MGQGERTARTRVRSLEKIAPACVFKKSGLSPKRPTTSAEYFSRKIQAHDHFPTPIRNSNGPRVVSKKRATGIPARALSLGLSHFPGRFGRTMEVGFSSLKSKRSFRISLSGAARIIQQEVSQDTTSQRKNAACARPRVRRAWRRRAPRAAPWSRPARCPAPRFFSLSQTGAGLRGTKVGSEPCQGSGNSRLLGWVSLNLSLWTLLYLWIRNSGSANGRGGVESQVHLSVDGDAVRLKPAPTDSM